MSKIKVPDYTEESNITGIVVNEHDLQELDIRSRTIASFCVQWYSHDVSRCRCLLDILQRRVGYSLRTIDWMVTNYCKRNPLTVNYGETFINVHHDYERHLSVYNKRFYDPFARREKITVTLVGTQLQSTVGQLNFFKWFIERDLHNTLKEYQPQVENHMRSSHTRTSHHTRSQDIVIHKGTFHVGFN